jgi:hypothetical protein
MLLFLVGSWSVGYEACVLEGKQHFSEVEYFPINQTLMSWAELGPWVHTGLRVLSTFQVEVTLKPDVGKSMGELKSG